MGKIVRGILSVALACAISCYFVLVPYRDDHEIIVERDPSEIRVTIDKLILRLNILSELVDRVSYAE